jgi:hypothetical protein
MTNLIKEADAYACPFSMYTLQTNNYVVMRAGKSLFSTFGDLQYPSGPERDQGNGRGGR